MGNLIQFGIAVSRSDCIRAHHSITHQKSKAEFFWILYS